MWYDKCLWDWELGPIILYDNVYNTVANLSVTIYHTISKTFVIHYTTDAVYGWKQSFNHIKLRSDLTWTYV